MKSIHLICSRRKSAETNSAAAGFFHIGGFSARRIYFRRIFGETKFFGGGGGIRRLGGLD